MTTRRSAWMFILVLSAVGGVVLAAALRLRHPGSPASPSTVLVFEVPDELEEGETPMSPLSLDLLFRNRPTLYRTVHALRTAARDPHVTALVLHVGDISWGWAKIADVRDALLEFRDAGKPVYASLTGGGDAEYFLVSAASWISAPPTAILRIDGLSESVLFLKGAFDKLDVHPNFAYAGRFKSAVESYLRKDMSHDSRDALNELLDDEFTLFVDSLASARGVSSSTMRALIDEGPFMADEARAAGLIDTLVYDAEVDSMAAADIGEEAPILSFSQYLGRLPAPQNGPRIALVTASGTISSGRSRYFPDEGPVLGSETLIAALREARTRPSIKAVVLRVDSPGGEMPAADDIWREVVRVRDEKPVVVSMSDYAASGGYYIATGADRIVAQPGTLTGSIGIYGGKLNVLGLYRKLGLNVETLSRGRHAEMMSPFRDFDGEESKRYKRQLEDSYRLFLDRVAEGRAISREAADSLAQGRVWSGLAAWERGLVDTLGGLNTAFEVALTQAGLSPRQGYRVEPFPRADRSFLERLIQDWLARDEYFTPGLPLPRVLRSWLAAARFPQGVSLALMPYSIEIR